ncbi:hypothetical protein DEO72_LG9g1047 [Vigna unguiculata]|uniref:Uncharacterized protein n=1 Tax=Vigna unguiculata TaxID=3917 RepID=A0A4D6MYC4_VIGUN|nr:hypothetical protein DEO72_LG9g1047 [Vigna unguiculata]
MIQNLKIEIKSLWREEEELELGMNVVEEVGSEAMMLSSVLEDRERMLLFLKRETKTLKQMNIKSEMKICDLERMIDVLEV